jgi:hypothetical protein
MKENAIIDNEDILERKQVFLWASHVRWINENKIHLDSLLRILLSKEILKRTEGENP